MPWQFKAWRNWLIFALFSLLTATNMSYAAEPSPIRIATRRPSIHPDLLLAHQQLQTHALAAAEAAYQKVLRDEIHNIDALLALAALAEHQGKLSAAALYRQQALAADPLDSRVHAALLNRRENPAAHSESRLKLLLSQDPAAAALHFALGNIYARQGRWPEAQAAYFAAVAADSDNPDYLCNLAISLDHLGQRQLAVSHYQRASTAAQQRPAGFTATAIEQRRHELSQ